MKKILDRLIFAIAVISIIIEVVFLILKAVNDKPFPMIIGIPSGFIYIVAFLIVGISALVKNRFFNHLFVYISSVGGLILATFISSKHILGIANCSMLGALPLCYLWVIAFAGIIGIKIIGYNRMV
jgi:hypothetical protein